MLAISNICADGVRMFIDRQLTAPELIIDGDTAATFSYVPTHIEYVLTELLKNAFRATCDAHPDVSHANLPPVRVTISITSPSETAENRSSSSPVVTIRVRDAGGGIPPEILPKVHSYAFTTVSPGAGGEEGNPDVSSSMDDEGPGPYGMQNVGGGVGLDDTMQGMQSSTGHLAGLGFGLPLSRLHCEVGQGGRCRQPDSGWRILTRSLSFLPIPSSTLAEALS